MSAQKRARAFSCPRFEFAVAQWRWRGRAPPPWAICAFFGRFSTNSPKNSPRAGQRSSNPHTNHGAAHLGPLYTRFSVIFRSFKTGLAGVDLPAFSFVYGRALVEGGHECAGEEVPRVSALACTYRGSQGWVMMHGVTDGGHYFGHLEESE